MFDIKAYSKEYYKKHREKQLAYASKWRAKHKEEKKEYQKKWRAINLEETKAYNKKYHAENADERSAYYIARKSVEPWVFTQQDAKKRCTNENAIGYKYYGGKGIKCLMSVEDFKFLWIRDGAGTMIKPSISRNDHDKDYTLDNCSYMEFSDHLSMDKSNIY